MQEVINYINSNRENYIEELKDFLRIQSISSDPEKKSEILRAAEFLKEKFVSIGLENIQTLNEEGNPVVYAEKIVDSKKPTILFYGHYDVQPVDPIELWISPPFEPEIRDGKIWARGATDDKGQLYTNLKSVEAFIKTNTELPVNIKFIIEGEEEIGSPSLPKAIEVHKNLLKCDAVVISDTSMYDEKTPSITYSLRGLAYFEIEITGPNRDLHSGTFGGAVMNPIQALCDLLSGMKDKNGKITIPGFYDDVLPLTKKERDGFKKLKFNEKNYMKELGVKELFGEKGYTTLERTWARPTLEINGIWGGYTGEGAKTVLPSKAHAKISMRLVPNQDPKRVEKLLKDYLKKVVPKSVTYKLTSLHGGEPAITPIDSKATLAASRAMKLAFGKEPVFIREGGSIPIVVDFGKKLKAPVVLMGFGLSTENLHSPNEHFDLGNYHKGILCSAYYMNEFSRM